MERIAAIFVSLDPRGNFDCLSDIYDRTIFVALGLIGGTAVDVCSGVPRVDLNRPGIVRDCLVIIAFGLIGDAAV